MKFHLHPSRACRIQGLLLAGLAATALAATADQPVLEGIGQFLDSDGDGRCDSVLVRFQIPMEANYRLRFTLCGSSWDLRPSGMSVDSSHRIYSARAATGSFVSGSAVCTEVNSTTDFLRVMDTSSDSVLGTVPMLDRIPPFIASAQLHQSSGPSEDDTLEVLTSEPVSYVPTGGSPLLRAAGGNAGIPVTFRSFLLSGQTRLYFFIDSASNFLPTDSIRLSPWSIQDIYGNEPGPQQRLTPVAGTYPTSGTKIRRSHGKPSGRPDRDVLGRPRTPGTKTKILDGFWLPDVRFAP